MIENQHQYEVTQGQLQAFEEALAQFDKDNSVPDVIRERSGVVLPHPLIRKAQRDALQSQIDTLRQKLKDFDEYVRQREI